jgi:hypothetical protein
VSCALHTPEQQSSFDVQSSHSLRHPPEGAHRWTPAPFIAQLREQQSSPVAQLSPTSRAHGL